MGVLGIGLGTAVVDPDGRRPPVFVQERESRSPYRLDLREVAEFVEKGLVKAGAPVTCWSFGQPQHDWPRFTLCRLASDRTNWPATISSSADNATCVTTRAWRNRRVPPPAIRRRLGRPSHPDPALVEFYGTEMQIVLVIFAISTVLGAWAGWRRSPLYSHKITAKLVGIFLLIVVAVMGMAAIVNGPVSLSPVAQGILAAAGIVVVATGATGLIIRTTDSHVAQLPSSVRVLTVERHKVQRWIWRTIAYLLICAAAALAFPAWNWLPLVLGSLVLLGCGPMLMGFYMRARRLDLGMSQVVAVSWAHWQYTPAQWEVWARNQLEWERSLNGPGVWKQDGWKLVKAILLMVALFALGSLMAGGSLREKIAITAGLTGFILVAVLSAGWFGRGIAGRHYRRLRAAPPEAYFGDEGVFCNGEFAPWILSGSYLIEATAPRDPPARVVLVFQTFNGSSSVKVARRVPIPEGREADVAVLQQKLRERCPKAAVRLA